MELKRQWAMEKDPEFWSQFLDYVKLSITLLVKKKRKKERKKLKKKKNCISD